jgi:hypothetical protein
MPINASAEYFKAEKRYLEARTREEKILALEEMIRQCPKHKGASNLLAQLKGKLAKLKKQEPKKKGKQIGIRKEGYAQVCILGKTNSGKSWLLNKLTGAQPKIAPYPYTTKKPEQGMMDYNGVKVQLIEIPSTFENRYMSIARTADALVLLAKDEKDKEEMRRVMERFFLRGKRIFINPDGSLDIIKQRIWDALGLIVVYTKTGDKKSPMALPEDATVKDFAEHIHKDFIRHFRFARLWRKNTVKQVGLGYRLKNNDVIELHLK